MEIVLRPNALLSGVLCGGCIVEKWSEAQCSIQTAYKMSTGADC